MTGSTAHVLVVITKADEVTRLSLRNAPGVHLIESGQLNTRDVLVSDHVVFTQEALDSFVARATGTVATPPRPRGEGRGGWKAPAAEKAPASRGRPAQGEAGGRAQ